MKIYDAPTLRVLAMETENLALDTISFGDINESADGLEFEEP